MAIVTVLAALLASHGCPGAPGPGTLAFARGGALHVVSLRDCRDRVVVRRGVEPPVRFGADGRSIEYGRGWVVPVSGGQPRPLVRAVRVTPAGGVVADGRRIVPDGWGAVDVRRTARGGLAIARSRFPRRPYRQSIWLWRAGRLTKLAGDFPGLQTPQLATVSPGGRVFWWTRLQNSNSLAADGAPLRTVGGTVARSMLLYRDYLAWCGARLVLVAGGSRLATENKRLAVAAAPSWRARPLVRDPKVAWASPVCAPRDARLVVLSQPVSGDFAFIRAHWSLWLVGLDGSRRRLTAPPARRSDESPRWTPGGDVLFVRRGPDFHGRLMLWRAGRVVGPFADLGRDIGYYGHHDWWFAADWQR